jgi:DNA-binding HxlR family transcriptional regulator
MRSGYGQYCPVSKGAEVFAERWTPLVVRNLFVGCHTFSQIHEGVPRMSRTLLSHRLRSLERDGIVERRPNPRGRGSQYFLSPAGDELTRVCIELGNWAAKWLTLRPQDLDPRVVLWGWKTFIRPEALPPRRVVIRFDLSDRPREGFWLLLHKPEPEVCTHHPGFEEDIVISTDCETLALVHMGRVSMHQATRSGRWRMEGPRDLVRAFPTWGGLSYFANVKPARTA